MKTSGVSCETKFGLLVFLGHPSPHGSVVTSTHVPGHDMDGASVIGLGIICPFSVITLLSSFTTSKYKLKARLLLYNTSNLSFLPFEIFILVPVIE